jgi:hypothetical protein
MKKIVLSLAISLVSTAVIAGVTYAIKKQGGIEPALGKIKKARVVSGALGKIDDLKQRFATNDTTDYSAAA